LIFPLQGRQGFRKYEGLAKAKDVSDAVGSPAAVFLVAGCSSGLKTGRVSLCHLDCPDQVGFFHLTGLDSHLFCNLAVFDFPFIIDFFKVDECREK